MGMAVIAVDQTLERLIAPRVNVWIPTTWRRKNPIVAARNTRVTAIAMTIITFSLATGMAAIAVRTLRSSTARSANAWTRITCHRRKLLVVRPSTKRTTTATTTTTSILATGMAVIAVDQTLERLF